MRALILLLFLLTVSIHVHSQCSPAGGLECESSPVLCSLDELDGFTCSLMDIVNRTGPTPLCGDGIPHNTSWWAFVGDGSFVSMGIIFDTVHCKGGKLCPIKGIQAGVLDECNGNAMDCSAICDNSTFSLNFMTAKCRTYYFWADGCCLDVCDFSINIDGGGTVKLPTPSKPELINNFCLGSKTKVCVAELADKCEAKQQWFVDGILHSNYNDQNCLEFISLGDGSPIEVCITYTLGNPNDETSICDQVSSCISLTPDSIKIINEGIIEVCWEDHQNGSYRWHNSHPDSVYNDSIYVVRSNDSTLGCLIEYRADSFIYKSKKLELEVAKFICDTKKLPFRTEDGRLWEEGICNELISWQDDDGCDTNYILNLNVFNPSVTFNQTCGACDGFVTLIANIDYDTSCLNDDISVTSFWLNYFLDTISISRKLMTKDTGKLYFSIHVEYKDQKTGIIQKCNFEGLPRWSVHVKDLSPNLPIISGSETICKSETGQYTIDNNNDALCFYEWHIKKGDGRIITPNFIDSSNIEIEWGDLSQTNGEICVSIKTDCGISQPSCFDVVYKDYPDFSNINIVCNSAKTAYQIFFNINGGDTSSLMIQDSSGWDAVQIDSNFYLTPWIPNGQGVSIKVKDKYGCRVNILDTIFDCMDVAVNNIPNFGVIVFPNPAHDFIHITSDKGVVNLYKMDIRIVDIQGRTIIAPPKTSISGGILLDVKKLSSGIYFIQMIKGSEMEVVKVIKTDL